MGVFMREHMSLWKVINNNYKNVVFKLSPDKYMLLAIMDRRISFYQYLMLYVWKVVLRTPNLFALRIPIIVVWWIYDLLVCVCVCLFCQLEWQACNMNVYNSLEIIVTHLFSFVKAMSTILLLQVSKPLLLFRCLDPYYFCCLPIYAYSTQVS